MDLYIWLYCAKASRLVPGQGILVQTFNFEATTATLCNGFMDSERVEIPQNFEEATVDHLIQLIGISHLSSPTWFLKRVRSADMLERLMVHNDRIPLSPYVNHLSISFGHPNPFPVNP